MDKEYQKWETDMKKKPEKCPICKKKMELSNDVLIEKARGSTILWACIDCEILIGRFT